MVGGGSPSLRRPVEAWAAAGDRALRVSFQCRNSHRRYGYGRPRTRRHHRLLFTGSLKSPWSRRRRKHALLAKQWKSLFDVDGKLSDGGVKFLKKIRTGGVEPSIRAEVWPFLLGFYDVKSSNKDRETIRAQKRREYVELRRQCRQIIKRGERSFKLKEMSGKHSNDDSGYVSQVLDSPSLDEVASARPSISTEVASLSGEVVSKDGHSAYLNTSRDLAELEEDDGVITNDNASEDETNSSLSESSDDPEDTKPLLGSMDTEDNHPYEPVASAPDKLETQPAPNKPKILPHGGGSYALMLYGPMQNGSFIPHLKLKIYHAARLVAILEAYAVYDPEIGYCQGMSDLLSPIISVIEEDHVAFWCFVGFMRKARHNFRLDEVGIRRQLNIVSRIIKCKDSHLYNHLEKLQAEDCFFVYRMVVVLFRRELTFEQTLCLWEVMWADQAAIRAGIVKSAWRRMRLRAPPTDDLLLYAIAACVLQRRKLIIENYNSMDEIMRECNSMAGNLDVWKLLDDAHDLVVTLHDKI
ncbi:UNVERIFIED_CONTAM: GTPase-activating protein GYP7 [Sesamum calycinum]|uniref:GTPase-activating protein GYP7 n=1 Tax=Sesamum calycinum TaxID=2727403 RepID=A0AAW2QZK7_9LAMI